MEKNSKIYIAGHRGLVGSTIKHLLKEEGFTNLVYRTKEELDLRDEAATKNFFETEKPEYVFLAAAKVGGILANQNFPADFIYNNLKIHTNVIFYSYKYRVKKLLYLGSSCVYPRDAPQPIKEEYLFTGPLEKTNEPYAIAKIAGLKLCQSFNRQYGTNFIAAMPTNLYGPHDNFDLENAHVLPAILCKFHQAKIRREEKVILWGTGKPKREFLYVDDLAKALLLLMQKSNPTPDQNEKGEIFFNVGSGEEISILDLAKLIAEIVGFQGRIEHDLTKPDGTPRKLLDSIRLLRLGFRPQVSLREGLARTYQWYLGNVKDGQNNRQD